MRIIMKPFNKITTSILLFAINGMLAACSVIDKSDYPTDISKNAATAKYISLPAEAKSTKIESYYPIPKLTPAQQNAPAKVSVVPPGSSLTKANLTKAKTNITKNSPAKNRIVKNK